MAKYSRARTKVDFYTSRTEPKAAGHDAWERLNTTEIHDLERRVARLAAKLEVAKAAGQSRKARKSLQVELFLTKKELECVRSMAQRAGDHLK